MAYVDHAFSISDEDIMMETSYMINNRPPVKEIGLAVSLLVFGTLGFILGIFMAVNHIGGDSAHGLFFAILGAILFIPGFYYTRIAYYAYKGYKAMDAWRKLGGVLEVSKAYILLVSYELFLAIFMILVEYMIADGVSALIIVVYEHVIATIVLFILAFFLERNTRPPLSFKILCYAFLLGLLQVALCQALLTMSLDYVSSTYQSIALNLVPAIVFVLALIFQQEKLKCWSILGQAKIWGLIISVGGALILVLWKGPVILKSTSYVYLTNLDATSDEVIGFTMIVVGITATSFWYVLLRHVIRLYPAEISLTAMMSLFGTVQTAIVAAFVTSKSAWELQWLNGLTLIVLLLGGSFVTGLAYYLMTWSVNKKGPVFTAAFNPLLIFFSILLQTVVLGNSTHLGSVVGAVLVMIGLYFLLWAKAKEPEAVDDLDDSLSAPLVEP